MLNYTSILNQKATSFFRAKYHEDKLAHITHSEVEAELGVKYRSMEYYNALGVARERLSSEGITIVNKYAYGYFFPNVTQLFEEVLRRYDLTSKREDGDLDITHLFLQRAESEENDLDAPLVTKVKEGCLAIEDMVEQKKKWVGLIRSLYKVLTETKQEMLEGAKEVSEENETLVKRNRTLEERVAELEAELDNREKFRV